MRFFFSSPVADSFQPQRHGDAEKTKTWGQAPSRLATACNVVGSRREYYPFQR